jgi:hypothetical protein
MAMPKMGVLTFIDFNLAHAAFAKGFPVLFSKSIVKNRRKVNITFAVL